MIRFTSFCVAALAGVLSPVAFAVDGLGAPDPQIWPRWQGRISMQTSSPLIRPRLWDGEGSGLKIDSLALLGDYYFVAAPLGRSGAGGFRATSGLLLGEGGALWAGTASAEGGLTVSSRRQSAWGVGAASDPADRATPYLGIGYTGLVAGGGWGFSADLGVAWRGDGLRIGPNRSLAGQEDGWRDPRVSPMLQLGVTHSF